ncbi:MAG: M28 family peptidase, partial [Acidobacteria bacterium]|nr:M28 family peptidase [Acidobacteriota bacterium]
LLAVARAFASGSEAPRRSVLFLAPTAEESGAVGSDYFMAHSPMPIQAMVAAINIDAPTPMLYPLYSVTAMGTVHSSLGPLAEDAARQLGLIVRSAPLAMRSDSPPFLRRGVPVLRVVTSTETGREELDGEQLTRDWIAGVYHTPRDDMHQPLDVAAVAAHARMNFLIGHRAAQDATRPRWNVGDFFGERFGR